MNISKRDLVRLHAALNGEFQDDGLVKIEIFPCSSFDFGVACLT